MHTNSLLLKFSCKRRQECLTDFDATCAFLIWFNEDLERLNNIQYYTNCFRVKSVSIRKKPERKKQTPLLSFGFCPVFERFILPQTISKLCLCLSLIIVDRALTPCCTTYSLSYSQVYKVYITENQYFERVCQDVWLIKDVNLIILRCKFHTSQSSRCA